MRKDEVKEIVAMTVKLLEERGLLKRPVSPSELNIGGSSPAPKREVRVTMGSAGKVVDGGYEQWNLRRAAGRAAAPSSAGGARGAQAQAEPAETDLAHEGKLTLAHVSSVGADRVGVCHPTAKGSPIAALVDHTLLKPNATQEQVGKLCEEAKKFCFASVCINPAYVSLAAQLLRGSGVKVCTVIGFPLGSTTPTVKAIEARDAIANGADEIDMVINVGALKSGNRTLVLDDIKAVRDATRGKVLKVIIETAYLDRDEKILACKLSKEAGADFVKTSTGFAPGGATVEDIRLMRETVGPKMGVKASGGVRDAAGAEALVHAGATRLGASASVAIVTGGTGKGGY